MASHGTVNQIRPQPNWSHSCKVADLAALVQTAPAPLTIYLSRPERPSLDLSSDASEPLSFRFAGLGLAALGAVHPFLP